MSTTTKITWKLGKAKQDRKNGGEFRVLKSSDGTWIGELRANDKEDDANGAIIESAPELLEALQFCLSVLRHGGLFELSERIAEGKAVAAISKATRTP